MLKEGVNGMIVPVKNKTALQKAMQELLDNAKKRDDMSRYSRSRIIDRYQQNYVWNELLKFYKKLE